jgi:hypothetical protein
MYRSKDYLAEISQNKTWPKCFSPANLNTLLDFLIEKQWLPSQVTIDRALTHLRFERTDGGSARKDAVDVRRKAQAQFDAACANAESLPLTPQELADFAALSFADLQRKYWADDSDFFRVRYNKASKVFGYKIPPRPQEVEEEGEDEADAMELSAAGYHAIPAATVCQRLRREPRFRRAVDRLVKMGAI